MQIIIKTRVSFLLSKTQRHFDKWSISRSNLIRNAHVMRSLGLWAGPLLPGGYMFRSGTWRTKLELGRASKVGVVRRFSICKQRVRSARFRL